MAFTRVSKGNRFPGAQAFQRVTVTFDNSYATGGELISVAELPVSRVEAIFVFVRNAGYLGVWDGSTTAPKIKMFQQSAATSALTEVPNTTNLSTVTADLLVMGY